MSRVRAGHGGAVQDAVLWSRPAIKMVFCNILSFSVGPGSSRGDGE